MGAYLGVGLLVGMISAVGGLWMTATLPAMGARVAGNIGADITQETTRRGNPSVSARAVSMSLTVAASVALVMMPNLPVGAGITLWIYTTALLTIAVIDIEHRRVLNIMLGPLAVLALALGSLTGAGLASTVWGGLFGLGLFLGVGLMGRGKLGAGDVKLAGVIGLMVGWPAVMAALLLGVVLGGVAALLLLLSRRATRKSSMAYAPYLVAGALWVLWLPLLMIWKG